MIRHCLKRVYSTDPTSFRSSFTFSTKDVTKWFPGHMRKGMRQMQSRLKNVDCIIEVHDARIPFSGRNPDFAGALAVKPHLLVLNKADLIDSKQQPLIRDKLKQTGIKSILFTDCSQQYDTIIRRQLVDKVMRLVRKSDRFNRTEATDYNLMVIGVPNVGKSSLINAMRRMHTKKGRGTRVGAIAGVTRSVLERIRVCENPALFLYDTPGILAPNVKDLNTGMKLAICATLQDHLVGEEMIVDYLLYMLNRAQCFDYVKHFSLPAPTDDVLSLLMHVASQRQLSVKVRSASGDVRMRPDFTAAAQATLIDFRTGKLGKVLLDSDLMPGSETRTKDAVSCA